LPILSFCCADFPIPQNVDDTLIIMKVSTKQLFFLIAILYTFCEANGLRLNFSKSNHLFRPASWSDKSPN